MNKAIGLILAAWAGMAGAAEPCDGVVSEVATRGGWTRTFKNGVATWKAPSGHEALTMAVYQLDDRYATAARRDTVLAKAADFDRALERRLSPAVTLSAVRRAVADGVVQLCWSGEDPAASRRFVSLSLAAGRLVQHFYYEAAGFTRPEFARNTESVFAGLPAIDAMAWQARSLAAPQTRGIMAMQANVPGLLDR
jgi:hypothetical protein